ncbi:MAG TPA: hypothetical protein VH592_23115 [Gemmataceae bacterium]|jgi:hypothetical protein
MTSIQIPKEVATFIGERIGRFAVEAPAQLRWQASFVAEFGALPLYLGWTETIGIRPDGEIIRWSTEGEYSGSRPVEERAWIVAALVVGSRRYMELLPLVPVRSPYAVDCYQCQNHPWLASGRVICGTCGGLGWLPQ